MFSVDDHVERQAPALILVSRRPEERKAFYQIFAQTKALLARFLFILLVRDIWKQYTDFI